MIHVCDAVVLLGSWEMMALHVHTICMEQSDAAVKRHQGREVKREEGL